MVETTATDYFYPDTSTPLSVYPLSCHLQQAKNLQSLTTSTSRWIATSPKKTSENN